MKLSDLWTENDGITLCPARVTALAFSSWYFIITGWHAFAAPAQLDLVAFGTSMAAVIVAVGGVIGYNKRSEGKS